MLKEKKKKLQSIINFVILTLLLSISTYIIISLLYVPLDNTSNLIKGDIVKYNYEAIENALDVIEMDQEVSEGVVEAVEEVVSEETIVSNWWEYPETILQTTKNGDDLLVLVNKSYQLPDTYIPNDLALVSDSGIRVTKTLYARSVLIDNLERLSIDIAAEGIDISVISAYRSFVTQQSTYNYWVSYNGGDIAAADTISARPGHSQHQLGTALDFSSSVIGDRVGAEFDNTETSKWLEENAYKYGFVIAYPKGYEEVTGYSYESWHYRYIGVGNAQLLNDNGEILENWLKSM